LLIRYNNPNYIHLKSNQFMQVCFIHKRFLTIYAVNDLLEPVPLNTAGPGTV